MREKIEIAMKQVIKKTYLKQLILWSEMKKNFL